MKTHIMQIGRLPAPRNFSRFRVYIGHMVHVVARYILLEAKCLPSSSIWVLEFELSAEYRVSLELYIVCYGFYASLC